MGRFARLTFCLFVVATAALAQPQKDEAVLSGDAAPAPAQRGGIAFYEEMIRTEPADPTHYQMLAGALLQQGRIDDARAAVRRAIELAPKEAELQQALGLVEEAADQWAAAVAAHQAATNLDGNVEYKLDLARATLMSGKTEPALAMMKSIESAYPANGAVQVALADTYKQMSRFDEADDTYRRALPLMTTPPDRSALLLDHARMLADRASLPTALALLQKARDATSDDPDVHYNIGIVYFRSNQMDAAVKAFDRAVQLKADFARAKNNRGVALDRIGKTTDAMASFKEATINDDRFSDAHYNLGLAAFKLRKFDDARRAFESCLRLSPDNADARFYLGEIAFQQGDPKAALRLFKEAIRNNPQDADTRRRLGDLHLEAGQLNLAVGEYWAAVDADEKNQVIRAQLMRVLLVRRDEPDLRLAAKLGDAGLEMDETAMETRLVLAQVEVAQQRSPRARQLLEAGITLAPKDPRPHVALASLLRTQGLAEPAEKSCRSAIEAAPKNAAALLCLGDVLQDQGNNADAEKNYRAALQVQPGLAEARTELAYLAFRAGKTNEAIKELERATLDAPRLARAWYYLGAARYKAGQKEKVEVALKKATTLQPDLAEAHLLYGQYLAKESRNDEARAAFLQAEKARGGTYEEARFELEKLPK
jgi:tetratricopeptide (TPR) repeat protein